MMTAPNQIQLQKKLAGVDYPVEREQLISHAQSHGADDAVIQQLQRLPDRTYHGPNAVSHAFADD
ncbi:MAG: DUF2795 domain-containing protein [Terriglobales bacterium]